MPSELTLAEANILVREVQADCGADPCFAEANRIAGLQLRGGLYFQRDGQVCVPDCGDLRERIIREAHDLVSMRWLTGYQRWFILFPVTRR